MKRMNRLFLLVGTIAVVALGFAQADAATVVINNLDGPAEGFNDPTPVAPVGGNPGVTLGQQRLNAFTHAANIWAQCLFSNVTIEVDAQMNPQFCNAGGAVLGSAGATTVHRDFGGAPKVATWYNQALANSLANADLAPGTADINATFNSDIDNNNNCLAGTNWYYGLDANPGSDIDFVTVVLHEIGHGIGFQTFQNSAGAWFAGFQDSYGCLMYHDGNVPPQYPAMTQAQRGVCNLGDPNLVFDGTCAKQFGANLPLTAGVVNGRPRLHGPNPYQGGSSLSHWSPALFPNQLMEPFYAGANHSPDMDVQLLKDTGWVLDKTVATAVSSFVVRNGGGGVEIMAEFASDVTNAHVRVYRGEGEIASPTNEIGGRDVRPDEPFRFMDKTVQPGKTYSYRIGVEDGDGRVLSPVAQITIPLTGIALGQNKPNPFNPSTVISFTLPTEQQVRLSVYDASGRLIRSLVDDVRSFGPHDVTWDGRDNTGVQVSSGIYFYRLSAQSFQQTRKMVLIK